MSKIEIIGPPDAVAAVAARIQAELQTPDMSSINNPNISDNYPAALDDAMPCVCGGHAITRPAGPKADISRLECDNPRCGRIIPIGNFRGIADAVTRWNDEVRAESCIRHSWMRQPSDGPACKAIYHCVYCGAVMP